MKKSLLCSLVISATSVLASVSALAANPDVVNGVATYNQSVRIGTQFRVPNSWTKIVIKPNVTITGSFFVPSGTRTTNNLTIEGVDRKTSVIQGDGAHDNNGTQQARQKSAVRYEGPGAAFVKNLTSKNSVKFHLWANEIHVDSCDVIETNDVHTTDGVHGGQSSGSTIKNSYISVFDDATYISETSLIQDTTIVHRKNGSPFQIGWGENDYRDNLRSLVKNVTVIANGDVSRPYNQGTVSWANNGGGASYTNSQGVDFVDLKRVLTPGKFFAPMYQFGTPGGGKVVNGSIKASGACEWKNSVLKYNGSTGTVSVTGC